MIAYVVYTLFVIACFILILVVLLQPGKGDVASALGGGAGGAAFGPRGTTSLLAKVTIVSAILFMGLAFLFSIPGVITPRSVTSGVVTPDTTAPEPAPAPATVPAEGTAPATEPAPAGGTTLPAGTLKTDENGRIPAQSTQQPATDQPAQPAQPAAPNTNQ